MNFGPNRNSNLELNVITPLFSSRYQCSQFFCSRSVLVPINFYVNMFVFQESFCFHPCTGSNGYFRQKSNLSLCEKNRFVTTDICQKSVFSYSNSWLKCDIIMIYWIFRNRESESDWWYLNVWSTNSRLKVSKLYHN